MDPLLRLVPALYTALAEPPLSYAGADVKVYQHLAEPEAGHYVLIEQPTSVGVSLNPKCRQWTCTILADIVTQFAKGKVSTIPAATLADQITTRLEGKRLPLPDGWDCGPGTLELQNQVTEDGELLAVRKLLRFRWDISYNA